MYLSKGTLISGDAGHNCFPDSGAVGIKEEGICTKEIWNMVMVKLNNLGYKTKDCTPWEMKFNSIGESLKFRVSEANKSKSSLHLSIHFSAGKGRGVRCLVNEFNGKSEKIANKICNEISKLGYYNRGVESGYLYTLEYTNMPCIIIECAFVTSKEDMEIYNKELISTAIVEAVTNI
ncbi:N-acetylmuramoyl-L-alanine amidase [Clostridium fallax]|uniref:N-acetylmuramoyl-L-alanine amidase n=1 Tax=Clostridium fallax TaxID=1533 RepID=A0A1M4VVQ0_9CLOT|nr:N-acetylmuramoyl-L-alanine amidase [Clostridium fallax]SHE72965.1 N-acetylmuramoyl-L-alanine amidase [Clostridium fallax]SQB07715.1 N-acetylmuramoyl-L-alanine amidase [Clostridium fallax]